MSNPTNPTDEWLDEILDELQAQVEDGYTRPVNGWTSVKQQAKQSILAHFQAKELLARADELEKVADIAYANYDQTVLGEPPKVDIHDYCVERAAQLQTQLKSKE